MGLFRKLTKQESGSKQYYGWSMRTSHFNPHDIVLRAIDNYVPMVDEGTNQFVLLLPPKEIQKCNGMKEKTYAKDNVSLDDVLKAMKDLFEFS